MKYDWKYLANRYFCIAKINYEYLWITFTKEIVWTQIINSLKIYIFLCNTVVLFIYYINSHQRRLNNEINFEKQIMNVVNSCDINSLKCLLVTKHIFNNINSR